MPGLSLGALRGRIAPTPLRVALGIAVVSALWLGASWQSLPGRGAERTPQFFESSPELIETLSRSDPLLSAVAGLDPADRGDDLSGGLPYWPVVARNPDREGDRAAAAGVAPAEPALPAPETRVVAEGETFLEIALALGVDERKLAEVNHITDPDLITVGQKLVVPRPADSAQTARNNRAATLNPRFIWPLGGNVTTYFGEPGAVWIGGRHTGLDIAGREGDPIAAAESGTVVIAGWAGTRGFGNYVVIDHGLGFQTLYGHLSEIRVEVGQQVARGQWIGDCGSTGVSFGPHLHFEVELSGAPSDPLSYLPE